MIPRGHWHIGNYPESHWPVMTLCESSGVTHCESLTQLKIMWVKGVTMWMAVHLAESFHRPPPLFTPVWHRCVLSLPSSIIFLLCTECEHLYRQISVSWLSSVISCLRGVDVVVRIGNSHQFIRSGEAFWMTGDHIQGHKRSQLAFSWQFTGS